MPKYPRSYPEVKQVIQGASVIQVKDPEQTARYYRDKLGFEYDFGSERYSVVWRDNAAVHFTKSDRPASGVGIFLWVKDADKVYEEVRSNGAEIKVEIGDREYGIRDFGVEDINGLEVTIGQDI